MQVKVMTPVWKWILSENVIKQGYNYLILTMTRSILSVKK